MYLDSMLVGHMWVSDSSVNSKFLKSIKMSIQDEEIKYQKLA